MVILIDKSGAEPRLLFTDEPELHEMERAVKSVGYRAVWYGNKFTNVIALEEREDGRLERVRVWEACLVELPTIARVSICDGREGDVEGKQ